MPRLPKAVRQPDQHDLRRPPPAATGLGPGPLLHGVEPLERTDRPGTEDRPRRRSGDDLIAPGGIVERRPEVALSGEVECDEVYVVAGYKDHPAAVVKKGRPGS